MYRACVPLTSAYRDLHSVSTTEWVGVYPRIENSIPQDLATILGTTGSCHYAGYYRIPLYRITDRALGPTLTRTHAHRRMPSKADAHSHAFAHIRMRSHTFARMHARSRQQPSSVAPAARQHVQLLDKELGRLALRAVEEADAHVDQLTDQHVVGVVVLYRIEEAEEVEECQLRSCQHTRMRQM